MDDTVVLTYQITVTCLYTQKRQWQSSCDYNYITAVTDTETNSYTVTNVKHSCKTKQQHTKVLPEPHSP